MSQPYPMLYRGSVKDVLGPLQAGPKNAVVFQYTDSFSVFDWGKMPDGLKHKGEALAVLAASWFEQLERAETWKEFSRSSEALALRKGNRFGSVFNELGEELQGAGLRTHYIGLLRDGETQVHRTADIGGPARHLLVEQVNVTRPTVATVLGRSLPDYFPTRNAPAPRLVPLEVVFRFACPPGSSLLERVARDPGYMASIGFPDNFPAALGNRAMTDEVQWGFPVLELFTKLESTDRPVPLSEALAISGLSAPQLERVLLLTAWVAGFLKWTCARRGLRLADGKLEWALDAEGRCFLVDAIGPDELRLLKKSKSGKEIQLSKEFLRDHYRATPWYEAVGAAKAKARTGGTAEWKRLVTVEPPRLPAEHLQIASQLYPALANELSGRTWFADAWSVDRVVESMEKLAAAAT